MKVYRIIICTLVISLLLIIYAISINLIKHEDFIGSYYCVDISPDLKMEINGTSTEIINKNDDIIIGDIDSMAIVDNAIYGIQNKKYFLLLLSNNKIIYSSIPIAQYSTCDLLSPIEYYKDKTIYIDVIAFVILLGSITIVVKWVIRYLSL